MNKKPEILISIPENKRKYLTIKNFNQAKFTIILSNDYTD